MDPQFNEYVITQICSNLSISDLKTVRTLNSMWNSGSKPILEKKGCNILNLEPQGECILKLINFHKNHFPCQAIKIRSSISCSQEISCSYQALAKLFYPLPSLKLLFLSLKISTERDNQLLNEILEYYSLSIKVFYLTLSLDNYQFLKLQPSLNFPELWAFSNLRSCGEQFYQQMFTAAPNISDIKVHEISSADHELDSLLKNPNLLPKLKGLIVQNLSVADLQYLAAWPRKLKSLNIFWFANSPNKLDLYRELQAFLQNQAESLITLSLMQLPCPLTSFESDLKLNFPPFPNIKILSVGFENYGFKFGFGVNGNINYERDFPKLTKLSIWSKYNWALFPVYASFFFGDENQICNTLLSLSLPNSSREFEKTYEVRLGKLFPNARIKYQA